MPATFAAVFAALYAAHMVADHWVQTDSQAKAKGADGWPGRIACAAHVATYTLTAVVFLALLAWRTNLDLNPTLVALGLTVSAISHYIADRRGPLRRLASLTKLGFYQVKGGGINGAYLLDQSWHVGWLFVAALVMA